MSCCLRVKISFKVRHRIRVRHLVLMVSISECFISVSLVSVWCCLLNDYNQTDRLTKACHNSQYTFLTPPCLFPSGFWEPSCLHGQDSPVSLSWSRQEGCAYRFCPANQRHPSQRRSRFPLPTSWHREWMLRVNYVPFFFNLHYKEVYFWIAVRSYLKQMPINCLTKNTPINSLKENKALKVCFTLLHTSLAFFYGTFSALSLLLDAHNPWSAHQALFLWHRSGPWDWAG